MTKREAKIKINEHLGLQYKRLEQGRKDDVNNLGVNSLYERKFMVTEDAVNLLNEYCDIEPVIIKKGFFSNKEIEQEFSRSEFIRFWEETKLINYRNFDYRNSPLNGEGELKRWNQFKARFDEAKWIINDILKSENTYR